MSPKVIETVFSMNLPFLNSVTLLLPLTPTKEEAAAVTFGLATIRLDDDDDDDEAAAAAVAAVAMLVLAVLSVLKLKMGKSVSNASR